MTKFCKLVKTCWFQHFPVLHLCNGHFRKIFNWIFKLVAELNAESIDSNFKFQKWKSKKLVCLLPFFILRPIWLNKVFSFFSRPFWTIGKFLPSRSEAEKLAGSGKSFLLLIILVPKVPSFYIRTKFRLKYHVTTLHLFQCKTNFFIHLCFWGRNLLQNKEHMS